MPPPEIKTLSHVENAPGDERDRRRAEAIDRVARAIYGPAYVSSADLRELKLDEADSAAIRRAGPDLPDGSRSKTCSAWQDYGFDSVPGSSNRTP